MDKYNNNKHLFCKKSKRLYILLDQTTNNTSTLSLKIIVLGVRVPDIWIINSIFKQHNYSSSSNSYCNLRSSNLLFMIRPRSILHLQITTIIITIINHLKIQILKEDHHTLALSSLVSIIL